jgi:hypothetical protein
MLKVCSVLSPPVAVEVLPVLVLPVLVVVVVLLEPPQETRLNAMAAQTAAAMSFLNFISFPPIE